MPRRILALAALSAAVALGVWGCQDYNFNPVGSCIIQPGSRQVRLEDVSVADVLFVVDDSGSMAGEQQNLARNFGAFIFTLAQENRSRVASGLKPLEFHLAITTSSVFRIRGNAGPSYAYSDRYDDVVNPADHGCTADLSCTAANIGKNTGTCTAPKTCGRVGSCCNCVPGGAVSGGPYPKGDFVAATGNPKVLHFTQSLPWTSWGCADDAGCATTGDACGAPGNTCLVDTASSVRKCCAPLCTPDAACTQVGAACGSGKVCGAVGQCCVPPPASIQALIDQFTQNVQVGTCGSAQEQHLQAARLAVQKALANQQPGAAGEWPHAGAKLVVAVMGDEDDCSNPPPTCATPSACTPAEVAGSISINDPTGATGLCSQSLQTCAPAPAPNTCPGGQSCTPIIGLSGFDGCTYDQALPAAQQKAYSINDLYAYFAGLGRPLGSAFVVSTLDGTCQYADFGATCQPGICCDTVCTGGACTSLVCGGQAPGRRLLQAATRFRDAGTDTVAGNICDQQFDRTLANIAQLVKSPSKLALDSVPAASDITVVRIADSSGGATRRICTPGVGWWFQDCDVLTTPPPVSAVPTQCIFINHASGDCEANPGETYSAEYLGQLPPGGCSNASPAPAASASCAQALPTSDGGPSDPNDWWCYGPAGGTGTCVCSSNAP